MTINWRSIVLVGIIFVVALLLPFWANPYYDTLLVMCLIYAIVAISFNLYLGFLGGLSLAHSAFFGFAGYVSGLLTVKADWNTGLGLIGAIALCALAAFVLGFAALRLKGAYFVLITIAFLGILAGLSTTLYDLTGSTSGLKDIPSPAIGFGKTVGADDEIKLDTIYMYEHSLENVEYFEDQIKDLDPTADRSDVEKYWSGTLSKVQRQYQGSIDTLEEYRTDFADLEANQLSVEGALKELKFKELKLNEQFDVLDVGDVLEGAGIEDTEIERVPSDKIEVFKEQLFLYYEDEIRKTKRFYEDVSGEIKLYEIDLGKLFKTVEFDDLIDQIDFAAIDLSQLQEEINRLYVARLAEIDTNKLLDEIKPRSLVGEIEKNYDEEIERLKLDKLKDQLDRYYVTQIDTMGLENVLEEVRQYSEVLLKGLNLDDLHLGDTQDFKGIVNAIRLHHQSLLDEIALDGKFEAATLYWQNQLEESTNYYQAHIDGLPGDPRDDISLYYETILDDARLHWTAQMESMKIHYVLALIETDFDKTYAYLATKLDEATQRYQNTISNIETTLASQTQADFAKVRGFSEGEFRNVLEYLALNYDNKLDVIDLSVSVDNIKRNYVAELDEVTPGEVDLSKVRLYKRLRDETPGDPTRDAFYKTGIHFQTTTSYYFLALAFLVLVFITVYRLIHSRVGRGFIAVRDNENLANSLGINPFKYKMIGFVTTAVIAAIGGWLYAHHLNIMDPAVFGFAIMFDVAFMVILGGTGTLVGPIVGAFFVQFVPELITEHIYEVEEAWRTAFMAIFMLVVIILAPNGIYGYAKMRWMMYRARQGMMPAAIASASEEEITPLRKFSQALKEFLGRRH